jgi:hypothetical protein
MAGEAGDAVTGPAEADASRRGLLRIGFGALTGSVLARLGGAAAEPAQARRRHTRRRNQSARKRDAQCRSRNRGVNRLGRVCCVEAGAHCTDDNDCGGVTSRCDLPGAGACFTP